MQRLGELLINKYAINLVINLHASEPIPVVSAGAGLAHVTDLSDSSSQKNTFIRIIINLLNVWPFFSKP